MAKAEKASEPTMDEILASIRKIIAEEPVSNKAGNAAARRTDTGADSKFPAPRASLDDILGMADVPSREPTAARSSDAAGTADQRPFPATPDALSAKTEPIKPAADSARPFFPAPIGSKPGESTEAGRISAAASEAKAESSRPVDFGSIVPDKAMPKAAQADVGDRRSLAGRLPEWLGGAGATVPAASGGASVPKPVAPAVQGAKAEPASQPKQAPEREAKPQGPSFPAPPVASAASQPSPASPSGTAGARPNPSSAADNAMPPGAARDAKATAPAGKVAPGASGVAGPGRAPEAKPAPVAPGAGSVLGGAPGNQAKSAPVAKTVPTAAGATGPRATADSPANGLAAGSATPTPAAPEASIPAAAAKSATAPVPVAETPSPMARPAALDKSKAVGPAPTGELVANTLPLGGVRTLDDTIIELLRPMIRQWLDDNMPRMVEKALRIEMAASLQAKGAASKPDSSKH